MIKIKSKPSISTEGKVTLRRVHKRIKYVHSLPIGAEITQLDRVLLYNPTVSCYFNRDNVLSIYFWR